MKRSDRPLHFMAGWLLIAIACFWLVLPSPARAQEGEKAPPKAQKQEKRRTSKSTPGWHTVVAGPFRVVRELGGHFAAQHEVQVSYRPRADGGARIERVLPHGTRVPAGAPVLWLEADPLKRKLAALRDKIEVAEKSLELEKLALATVLQKAPILLEVARRGKADLESDLQHFRSVARPQLVKNIHQGLRSAEYGLEYAEEELNQLKQMYEADDLTEETEEIILKRAQRGVERARSRLEEVRWKHKRQLSVALPRRERDLETKVTDARMEYEKLTRTQGIELARRKRTLQQHRREQQEQSALHERLTHDLETRVLKAPIAGILFHGKLRDGVWKGEAGALRAGRSVSPREVLLTIAEVGSYTIRASVPEKLLPEMTPGIAGYALLSGIPDTPLPVRLERISWLPTKPGQFETHFHFEVPKGFDHVRPSLSCRIFLLVEEAAHALTIPTSAVRRGSDGRPFVHVRVGKSKKRRGVVLGRSAKGRQVVLSGLEVGDQVWTGLSAKPQ